jgi:hypothetical protein
VSGVPERYRILKFVDFFGLGSDLGDFAVYFVTIIAPLPTPVFDTRDLVLF